MKRIIALTIIALMNGINASNPTPRNLMELVKTGSTDTYLQSSKYKCGDKEFATQEECTKNCKPGNCIQVTAKAN